MIQDEDIKRVEQPGFQQFLDSDVDSDSTFAPFDFGIAVVPSDLIDANNMFLIPTYVFFFSE